MSNKKWIDVSNSDKNRGADTGVIREKNKIKTK